MKDQYFGDVNDYCKYGLLRQFAAAGLEITVAWMLTPDDESSDGRRLDYLARPETWEHYDPRLFASLKALLSASIGRRVSFVENSWILPDTRFYRDLVPQGEAERARWCEGLLETARGSDLIFLDPDTGVEVPSTPRGTQRSDRYVYWSELAVLYRAGFSLFVYQHFPREKRSTLIRGKVELLAERTGAEAIEAFETSNVLFLLAAQRRHVAAFDSAMAVIEARWRDQVGACGFWNP